MEPELIGFREIGPFFGRLAAINAGPLLSGLLQCAAHGETMGGDSIPARSDAGDGYKRRRYRRYVCLRWKSRRDCDCEMHYVNAKAIERAVLSKVVEDTLRPKHLLQILQDARRRDAVRVGAG